MDAEHIGKLMLQLAEGVGQRRIALRCDCENLERVYVIRETGGGIRVTDDHRTFQYLDGGTDSTYVPIASVDLTAARKICQELGVELGSAPPDGYPSIECIPKPGDLVSDVIERVATAVDRIFNLAMRPDLK